MRFNGKMFIKGELYIMNFSRNFGVFCLVVITVLYVYFAFFNDYKFDGFNFNHQNEISTNTIENSKPADIDDSEKYDNNIKKHEIKKVKIYVTDSNGNLRSVIRNCDTSIEKSCFYFAIRELLSAPTKWEKSKGLSSEIPQGTKILSIREGEKNILIDLSPSFESGGGAESTYIRVHQLIKTSNSNTNLPVYLYINGKQANVIGGEGVMIKQPLNERSLDE